MLVELEEGLPVFAVVFVILEQEVVDPVGRHEDAKEEIPVVGRQILFEGIKPPIHGLVGVVDELAFVILVAEFRVNIDNVVAVVQRLGQLLGVAGLLNAWREKTRDHPLDVPLWRERDRDVHDGRLPVGVGNPIPQPGCLDISAHRNVGLIGAVFPILKAIHARFAGVDAGRAGGPTGARFRRDAAVDRATGARLTQGRQIRKPLAVLRKPTAPHAVDATARNPASVDNH